MPKRASKVVLSEKEQEAVQITKHHRSEQQQVQRARIILASAQGDSNAQIARELHITWIWCACGEVAG
jgi:DNA-binding CsgD family transcriptional regulator